MTEAAFQSQVIRLARLLGWRVAHFRTARVQRASGSVYYATPVQADGAGFPDLVMVRGGRVVFAELKSGKNKPSAEQEMWLAALRAAGQEVYVWYPCDWDILKGRLSVGG